jgi:hypothetical protein
VPRLQEVVCERHRVQAHLADAFGLSAIKNSLRKVLQLKGDELSVGLGEGQLVR